MLTHVVLFRLRSKDSAAEACRRLEALPAVIPTLKELEVGEHVGDGANGFHLALITRFDDFAGLEAYRVHPEHQKVVAFLKEEATDRAVVDFES